MKARLNFIILTIFLGIIISSANAMEEDPLTSKLHALKTNLETLREKFDDMRGKLQDLADNLDEDNAEDSDESARWSPFIQGEIQRAAEEREAFKKMITDQMYDWTPDPDKVDNFAQTTSTSNKFENLFKAACSFFYDPSHSDDPVMYIKTGDTYDVYHQNIGGDVAVWEKTSYDIYRKESLKPPPPLPSNPGFRFGAEATSIRNPPVYQLSQYTSTTLKKLEALSEAAWIQILSQSTSRDWIANENSILNNFENYRFPNFLSAARKTLHTYDDFMLDLLRTMDNDEDFYNRAVRTPGFRVHNFIFEKYRADFYDLVKKESDAIIKGRCQKAGCLDVSNKDYIKHLAEERRKKNREIPSKNPDKRRLRARLDALNKAAKTGGRGLISYSHDVEDYPKFTDPYAIAFGHTCGTILDRNLHIDLCDTRVMMMNLENEHHGNKLVASYSPIINRLTAEAKKETNIEKAYNLADYAYDVVNVVASGTEAITTGVFRATKGMLDPRTYLNAAAGVMELGIFFANMEEPMDPFDIANAVVMFPEKADVFNKIHADYEQRFNDGVKAAQKVYEQALVTLNNMTWQEKTSLVAECVTSVALPWLLPKALSLAKIASGRKLVNNLATTMKAPKASEYMAGIGTVEKIAATEGAEFAKTAVAVIKKNPSILSKPTKQAAKLTIEGKVIKLSDKAITEVKNVIQDYRNHIFSENHKAKGILKLGKNEEAIMNSIDNVIHSINAKNLLKEGLNQIKTTINGVKNIEIKLYIKNREPLSVNAFISDFNRIYGNFIDWS